MWGAQPRCQEQLPGPDVAMGAYLIFGLFKLKKDKAYNNREFSDIGKCKNIYVSYLEKVE